MANQKKKTSRHINLFGAPKKKPLAPASTTAVSVKNKEKFLRERYVGNLMSLSYEDVRDTTAEGDWHDIQSAIHGGISKTPKDKRNIIQKTADKLYESGPMGAAAAAVADVLPGIPFVDIIDPPSELADPTMQASRNLLGALSIPLMMSQAPKAIGRVATNVRQPFAYGGSLKTVRENVMYGGGFGQEAYWAEPSKVKRIGGAIGRAIKSLAQDTPLYELSPFGKRSLAQSLVKSGYAKGTPELKKAVKIRISRDAAVGDAREFLYRRTFGLKPRKGTKIFKENKDGTLSFNPESKRAQFLIDEIKGGQVIMTDMKTPQHSVMGGYSAKFGEKTIKYEDVWDFKMHPGEWKEIFSPNVHLEGWKSIVPYGGKRDLMAQAGLRTLIDAITTPPVIKGAVAF